MLVRQINAPAGSVSENPTEKHRDAAGDQGRGPPEILKFGCIID